MKRNDWNKGKGLGDAGSHQGRELTPDDYELEDLGDQSFEEMGFTPDRARELDAEVARQTALADSEIPAVEVRVNFRWGRPQLGVIKRAADLIGVPYQTYLKQIAMERALADISRYQAAMGE